MRWFGTTLCCLRYASRSSRDLIARNRSSFRANCTKALAGVYRLERLRMYSRKDSCSDIDWRLDFPQNPRRLRGGASSGFAAQDLRGVLVIADALAAYSEEAADAAGTGSGASAAW